MVRVADAGELQDVRRADGAGRKDHLTRGVHPFGCAVVGELNAYRALAVEPNAADQRVRDDSQIGPLQRRAQIGARRALPPAPTAGLLNPADVVSGAGRQMVHVLMVFEADLYAGLDHLMTEE